MAKTEKTHFKVTLSQPAFKSKRGSGIGEECGMITHNPLGMTQFQAVASPTRVSILC